MHPQQTEIIANRYQIESQLSHEGAVELYSALDQQLHRPVQVQMLSERASQDPDRVDRFLRHQQLAATIHHPSVLEVYDAGQWHGRPFSVMERAAGEPISSIYRGRNAPPDLATALRLTRQVAQGVQYCRDIGLSDWTLSHEVVRVDSAGNASISLAEQLGPAQTSSQHSPGSASDDVAALGGLLRAMLLGSSDAQAVPSDTVSLPRSIAELLERLTPGESSLTSAGEVAQYIASIEASFADPTEAHDPLTGEAQPNGKAAPPMTRDAMHPSEAPTLAVSPVPSNLNGVSAPRAYDPPTPRKGRRSLLPVVVPALALVLLGLLVASMWPRIANRSNAEQSTSQLSPTIAPVAVAPDLLGQPFGEANSAAEAAGLRLSMGEAVHSQSYRAATVALQNPPPGSKLAIGSVVTVSMSLGAENNPLAPVAPQTEPGILPPPDLAPNVAPQQGKKDGEEEKEKDKDEDRGKERDKDEEKDKDDD